MHVRAFLLGAALAVPAPEPAAAQQRPPDGGSGPAKPSAPAVPAGQATLLPKAAGKPEKPAKKAPLPPGKAPGASKTEDEAVIEQLDLLLLLDFLSDYDLFDEDEPAAKDPPASPEGGATNRAPGGSRGYRS